MQKKPINDHDYDSPSLKFAYAGNMWKNMLNISGICSIYARYMRCIFCTYFASKSSTYFKKILCYKPTSL